VANGTVRQIWDVSPGDFRLESRSSDGLGRKRGDRGSWSAEGGLMAVDDIEEYDDTFDKIALMSGDELFAIMNDRDVEANNREFAFYQYWIRYIKERGILDDVAIRGILRYKDVFPIEAGGLLTTACWINTITPEQATALALYFREDALAGPVLLAYPFIFDSNIPPFDKINRLLSLTEMDNYFIRSYCWRLIPSLRQSDLYLAAVAVIGSRLPMTDRKELIERLKAQADSLGTLMPGLPEFPEDADADLKRRDDRIGGLTKFDLRQIYVDGAYDMLLRRICFVEYWNDHFSELDEPIMATRSDLEEILAWVSTWPEDVSSVVETLCRYEVIEADDARWLIAIVPSTLPAYRIIQIYFKARNDQVDGRYRVQAIVPFFAQEFWPSLHAVLHVLHNASLAELETIQSINDSGSIPERAAIRIHTAILRRRAVLSNGG